MHTRPRLILALFCVLLLAGCATKQVAKKSAVNRFPDQPAATLAKTPGQSMRGELSRNYATVNGGWGYKPGDAFVLTVPAGYRQRYNTVPLESLLVRTRNEVEFSETPAQGQRYTVVDYGTVSRTIGTREGRMYAVWRGQVRLISEKDDPILYKELAGRSLARRDTATAIANSRVVPREYWFDVTDTFAHNRPFR